MPCIITLSKISILLASDLSREYSDMDIMDKMSIMQEQKGLVEIIIERWGKGQTADLQLITLKCS